ncbi:MAG TPA: glycosyltransferase family 4 protein [Anaerolineae bacterium]|nr:glycosyltransferase family 4 protein [Anaerolineae bacterium]
MRIVRLVSLYPPYVVGGNEMLTRDIAEALLARGHDVHVLTAHGQRLDGIPYVHQVFNYNLDHKDALFQGGRKLSPVELVRHHVFDPVTYRSVRRVVQELRPDLVVADNLYMASAAALFAVRDVPCPVVAQVADKWLLFILVDWGLAIRPRTALQRLFVRSIRALLQRPIARRVRLDGIVTVSDFIRDLYVSVGFPPETLETEYLGIHNEVFSAGPAHPLNDPVRLVFVGGLWEGKGPQVAVQALRILSLMDDMPRFHLDLFGEGSQGFKRYLDGVIREAGVEEQVAFHGFVPWQRLAEAMRESDVFVFPSIWDEPFAITPLQALGCGLPVVAARAGGTAEGFVDGETALLIPPNDAQAMAAALARIVRDDTLRQELRTNGLREARERWSFDAYVDRLTDYYDRVVQRWRCAQRHHVGA